MRKSSRLALLVFSSLLLSIVPPRQSEECGSYPDWEEYRMRFFEPGLDGQVALSPFYYTQHWLYGNAESDPEREDMLRNCREWQSYLGRDVALADIDSILYGGKSADDILIPLKSNGLESAFPGNTFVKRLIEPRHHAALEYLTFTKKLEFLQHAEEDPWQEWPAERSADTTFYNWDKQVETICKQSLDGLDANASDPFLKKRYAYQAIVCQRYYGDEKLAVSLFDRNFNLQDSSILMPWALIHKAECLLHRGDSLEYNYLLAKVFDNCNDKKKRAGQLFVSAWTEKTLTQAPTPVDKALVLTMQAMQYPGRGFSLLSRIVNFDPNCRYLPLLISREINKLEDWTLTEKLTGYESLNMPDAFYQDFYSNNDAENMEAKLAQKEAAWRQNNLIKDRAYLRELRQWIETLLQRDGLPGQRDFLKLAAAHLLFLEGNYSAAQAQLSGISSAAPARLRLQRDVESLLLVPYYRNVKEATVQNDLASQLRHIWEQRQYLDQPAIQMSRLHFYLCHALFKVGDIPAAGLMYNKATYTSNEGGSFYSGNHQIEFFDAHARLGDLDKLISLQVDGPKTPFEKYLMEKPAPQDAKEKMDAFWWYGEDSLSAPLPPLFNLLELQGTIAFREGDLQRSVAVFERLPNDFWTDESMVDVDIFADAAHFPFDTTPSARGAKTEVVRRMLALEAESKKATGARLSEIYYQLGNAWFNCSYWGRSWYMFSYARNHNDDDGPEIRDAGNFPATPDVRRYGGTYFRFDRALAWYRQALASNPPKELAAKIEYMIADCDRYVRIMRGGNESFYGWHEDGEQALNSPLFRQWAARYGRTATFTERMQHCPELKDYLGQ